MGFASLFFGMRLVGASYKLRSERKHDTPCSILYVVLKQLF